MEVMIIECIKYLVYPLIHSFVNHFNISTKQKKSLVVGYLLKSNTCVHSDEIFINIYPSIPPWTLDMLNVFVAMDTVIYVLQIQ